MNRGIDMHKVGGGINCRLCGGFHPAGFNHSSDKISLAQEVQMLIEIIEETITEISFKGKERNQLKSSLNKLRKELRIPEEPIHIKYESFPGIKLTLPPGMLKKAEESLSELPFFKNLEKAENFLKEFEKQPKKKLRALLRKKLEETFTFIKEKAYLTEEQEENLKEKFDDLKSDIAHLGKK